MYTPSSDISTLVNDSSPSSLSLETLSQLSREFFSNRPVGLIQEGVEIARHGLSPQNLDNFIVEIYNLFGDITNASNAQDTCMLNFAERNVNWKKLKYM
jgi:hypothetical protein